MINEHWSNARIKPGLIFHLASFFCIADIVFSTYKDNRK